LAGRYDNPIPTWFLAPIDCLKISAQSNLVPKTLYADSLKRFLTLRGKCRILDHEVFDLGVWWFPRGLKCVFITTRQRMVLIIWGIGHLCLKLWKCLSPVTMNSGKNSMRNSHPSESYRIPGKFSDLCRIPIMLLNTVNTAWATPSRNNYGFLPRKIEGSGGSRIYDQWHTYLTHSPTTSAICLSRHE
jgi:hypothetical protein